MACLDGEAARGQWGQVPLPPPGHHGVRQGATPLEEHRVPKRQGGQQQGFPRPQTRPWQRLPALASRGIQAQPWAPGSRPARARHPPSGILSQQTCRLPVLTQPHPQEAGSEVRGAVRCRAPGLWRRPRWSPTGRPVQWLFPQSALLDTPPVTHVPSNSFSGPVLQLSS